MIYFIRHGETDYNKVKRFQGHLDIPLNQKGVVQAKLALEGSKNLKIDKIYYSPLKRAAETANIINSFHNAKMIKDDRIKEINMGSLQGKYKDKLKKFEQILAYTNPERFGGESHEQFCKRVKSFLDEIINSTENILIVSHGGVYRAIYKIMNNLDNMQFELVPLPNAKIITIKE
jgi:broad specificity phosphatase PhoE